MTGPAFFAPVFPQQDDLVAPHHSQTTPSLVSFTVHHPIRPPPAPRPINIPLPSVMLTGPTPISSPPHSPPPPSYATPLSRSPPKYLPFPSSQETALLLAPPPPFSIQSVCYTCDPEGVTTCRHTRRQKEADWVVRALIILNVLVWALVIWGYWREWSGGDIDWNGGKWMPGGPDGGVIGGWGYDIIGGGQPGDTGTCIGENCGWAFVNC